MQAKYIIMASKPGVLTHWPWESLGIFKYLTIGPWVFQHTYSYIVEEEEDKDLTSFLIFPFLISRLLHSQLWISLSRYRTAKGNNRIVDKGIEFEQVDRESNWDDQILLSSIMAYAISAMVAKARHLPMWRTDGVLLMILLHIGPVEFVYYWFHRLLHHHYLYSRYHSHHHSSIVTEPITSVIHPFAEMMAYYVLFFFPIMVTIHLGTISLSSVFGYLTFIDFMNYMGHCNFEFVPSWLFSVLPPLKYLIYTPSYHSLHHTQFRVNYALFMPIYDYIYGTADGSTDALYDGSLRREEELPDVVHLTHFTTVDSIFHMRLGLASLASRPHRPRWWISWLLAPATLWAIVGSWISGKPIVIERNQHGNLKMQTWVLPNFSKQYAWRWKKESINRTIEEAIASAEKKGIRVLTLGLLNQSEELNNHGEIYVRRNPGLKMKLVDGTSLAVAVVVNSIPEGTTRVLLASPSCSKVAAAVALVLCQKGIQVLVPRQEDYDSLRKATEAKKEEDDSRWSNLVLSERYDLQIWLVGERLGRKEQKMANKGTFFIPFSQFPPREFRKDCYYHSTPAMSIPKTIENVDSCENWLPRRVLSAWRVAGIVHACEGWIENECGNETLAIDRAWEACLVHGFTPLPLLLPLP